MTEAAKSGIRLGLCLLGAALTSTPAFADGLGGLAAMRAFFLITFGIFVTIWVLVCFVLRAKDKRRRGAHVSWIRDPGIPVGLRVLAVVQYVLAFVYSMMAFYLVLLLPGDILYDRLAADRIHIALFSVLFAVLAILSANGYRHRSLTRGFKLGSALGWLCVGNAALYVLLHGWNLDFDGIAPLFGATVLVILNWRYRPYFSVE